MNTQAKLKNLEIQNFRGIKHLKIEMLSKINIFVGRNSIGKTSILEALWLITGKQAENIMRLNVFRKLPNIDGRSFIYSFYSLDENNKPTFTYQVNSKSEICKVQISLQNNISGKVTFIDRLGSNLPEKEIKLEYYEQDKKIMESCMGDFQAEKALKEKFEIINENFTNKYNAVFIDSSSTYLEYIRKTIIDGEKETLLDWLKQIIPDIEDGNLVDDLLFIKLKNIKKLVPINMMGDGVVKMILLFNALHTQENQFVSIDEIENGLHYRSQIPLWEMLAQQASQNNVDLFISTHSYEMLQSLVTFLRKKESKPYCDLFMIHTLFKKEDSLRIRSAKYERFSEKLTDGFEIRGLH